MEVEHKKYLDSVDARIAGAKVSMLAMAAPLESSTSSSGSKLRQSTPAEAKKPEKEVPNQKIGLLHALLLGPLLLRRGAFDALALAVVVPYRGRVFAHSFQH